LTYWIHEEAETELGDAAVYLALHASKNVGVAFLEDFERVVEIVVQNQHLGTPADGGLRTYPFKTFPYSLIYREDDDSGPQIYAVAPDSREPGYWKKRI
jgi:hypothetical protein